MGSSGTYGAPTVIDVAEASAPPRDWATELQGVRLARWAAIVSLLGIVVVLLLPLYMIAGLGYGLAPPGTGSAQAAITGYERLAAAFAGGAALVSLALVLFTVAFSRLSKVDEEFVTPFVLSIIGLAGALMLVAAFGLLLASAVQALGCLSAPDPAACYTDVSLSSLYQGLAIGGLILAFIGWIALLLGVFRIGKRYASTPTKVGAILYLVPLVNLVAPILVVVGMHGVVRSVEAGKRAGAG
jgi:Protein of unknown function (DUF973)